MIIDSVRVSPRRWRVSASNAHRAWTEREGRLVTVTDRSGKIGLGEASPLPGYSPDSLAQVDEALQGLAERLRAPFDSDGNLDAQLEHRLTDIAAPSARFAVESSLWDLWSRRFNKPLAVMWGASTCTTVPTATLIDPFSPQHWPQAQVATLKVKVGRPGRWSEELAAIVRLRAAYPGVPFRLDANRSFPRDVMDERLAALSGVPGIEFIEEPGPNPWPDHPPLPLAADESVRSWAGRCEYPFGTVVLKPSVLGGVACCRSWLSRGVDVVVSHVFEGPIAHAAASAWAIAYAPKVVAGLGPHAGLDGWPDLAPTHVCDDHIVVPSQPGLGWVRMSE